MKIIKNKRSETKINIKKYNAVPQSLIGKRDFFILIITSFRVINMSHNLN